MTEVNWLAATVPLIAEAVWGYIFLPRARRFFRKPSDWCFDPNEPDIPPTLAADLAWRELFVLYHLPGVAVVDTAWRVLRLRHSLWSVVTVMAITGGAYAALAWLLSRYL
jgi:hypothetical protein